MFFAKEPEHLIERGMKRIEISHLKPITNMANTGHFEMVADGTSGLAHSGPSTQTFAMALSKDIEQFVAALNDAPEGRTTLEDHIEPVDHLAARLLGILSQISESPSALVNIQRLLSLMGGRRPKKDLAIPELLDALDRLDLDMGIAGGGFSRMIAETASEDDGVTPEGLDPASFNGATQDYAKLIRTLAEQLSLLDDIGFALGLRTDLPGTAAVLDALFTMTEQAKLLSTTETGDLPNMWLKHRGVSVGFRSLFALRPFLGCLTHDCVLEAQTNNIVQPFALWVLSHRLKTSTGELENAEDYPLLVDLLAKGSLAPIEVLSLADLWKDSRPS
jgi:hypothetical protein